MNEQYFLSILKNIQNKHLELLKTPRAKASLSLKSEIKDFLDFLHFSIKCHDISDEFYDEIKTKIEAISFEDLATQRKYLKKKEKNVHKR